MGKKMPLLFIGHGSPMNIILDNSFTRRLAQWGKSLPRPRAILVVSSANRDRDIWGPSADDFDIWRPRRAHLSFAIGPHYCIGHHFARAQLHVAIRMLIERFPRMRLEPDHETVYRGHEYRSPTALRVLVD